MELCPRSLTTPGLQPRSSALLGRCHAHCPTLPCIWWLLQTVCSQEHWKHLRPFFRNIRLSRAQVKDVSSVMTATLETLWVETALWGFAACASAMTTSIPTQLEIAIAWRENAWSASITRLASTVTGAKTGFLEIPWLPVQQTSAKVIGHRPDSVTVIFMRSESHCTVSLNVYSCLVECSTVQ